MHEIGTDTIYDRPVFILLEALRRHIYVLGKSGMGKSGLLELLALALFEAGQGFAFFDPHGQSAEKIADCTPKEAFDRTIYFDASDTGYSYAYNILDDVQDTALCIENVLAVFVHVLGLPTPAKRTFYDRVRVELIRNSLRLLLDTPGQTLLDIARVLSDDDYRQQLTANTTDQDVRGFWEGRFAQWSPREHREYTEGLLADLSQLFTEHVQRVVGHKRSTIRPARIMNEGKALICNFSKGRLGAEPSYLLQALFLTGFAQAAHARASIPEERRLDFTAIVDEVQNAATTTAVDVLAEARKYRFSLVAANQYLSQLPEYLRDALFGAASTLVSFRVSNQDAKEIASELTLPNPDRLKDLPLYEAFIKTIDAKGNPTMPTQFKTHKPPESGGQFARVRRRSRARYARKVKPPRTKQPRPSW